MARGETYEEFVAKFEKTAEKTTDDCITPQNVYNAIKDWAVKEYGLEGREIVRPFWPGGDFESYDYPEGCVVIDNPPFSILKKIKSLYLARGIDFFLFAPTLQLFGGGAPTAMEVNYVVNGNVAIVYANGAVVTTAFVTNMGDAFIQYSPELALAVRRENQKTRQRIAIEKGKYGKFKKYQYPPNVISGALLSKYEKGAAWRIEKDECAVVRCLDAQRAQKEKGKRGSTIYGGGFFVSDGAVKRLQEARLTPLPELPELECDRTYWELSEREKVIIEGLNEASEKRGERGEDR